MALVTTDSTTLHASLPATQEEVFALLTDPARIPQWLQGCRGVSPLTPIKKGTRLNIEFARGTTEFIITDFVPGSTFGWTEHGARQGTMTHFKLAFAGSMTTVTMRMTWAPKTLRAWILGTILRRRSARRMFETAMVEMRRLLGR
jgi:uncharacterized protein YndB with AHSA1/START domain